MIKSKAQSPMYDSIRPTDYMHFQGALGIPTSQVVANYKQDFLQP